MMSLTFWEARNILHLVDTTGSVDFPIEHKGTVYWLKYQRMANLGLMQMEWRDKALIYRFHITTKGVAVSRFGTPANLRFLISAFSIEREGEFPAYRLGVQSALIAQYQTGDETDLNQLISQDRQDSTWSLTIAGHWMLGAWYRIGGVE